MIKRVYIFILFSCFAYGVDSETMKQQNILLVKDLIDREEKISKAFEKYILTEFSIPTIANLQTANYLGTDFSIKNEFGTENIKYKDVNNLQLKYAIDKTNLDEYIGLLYNRPLYREYTSVYYNQTTLSSSYIKLKLQSDEAKNIFSLLSASKTIEDECPSSTAGNYCSANDMSIRWYKTTSTWIEYSKKYFEKGDVTVSDTSMLSDDKLKNLPIGTYIYLNNGSKYVRLMNDTSGNLRVLKVD